MRTRSLLRAGVRVALVMAGAAMTMCSRQPEFDLVIRGGTVYDGTGQPDTVRRADIGVKGDRVVAIGDLSGRPGSETIDATGKAVAPGFIDVHGRSGLVLLTDGYGESHLRQGITSEIIADHSPAFWTTGTADLSQLTRRGIAFDWKGPAGYFQKLESKGTAINIGTLVPTSIANTDGQGPSFVDAAMRGGALGVIDDASGAGDLTAMVAAAGLYNGVFMSPLGEAMPAADSAEHIMAAGARARAIVITELTATVSDAASRSAVIQALASATRRKVVVYASAAPYAGAGQASDAEVRQAFGQWGITIGTNTAAMIQGDEGASRAAFGAFPRLLGQWVRDDRVVTLSEAIRRITSVPASIFDLPMRGIIREQFFADLVVFDPATVGDRSTDQKPGEYPSGITHVIVNGVVTLAPNGLTGARAGHRLIGPGARRRPT